MLTARGRRTITLGLIAGAAGRVLGIPEFLGLATAVVVVTLAALIGVRVVKCTLTVTARALPPVVSVDEPAVLELTIEAPGGAGSLSVPVTLQTDHSLRPVPHQPTRITVPRLVRDGRAMARFAISTERRGLVDAGGYEAVISDPLGLAVRRVSASRPTRCVVLPRIEALASVLPEGLGRTDAESALSLAERPITASSMLRPYAHGDDLRRVHWRTTARVGKLMVRDGGDRDEPDRIATTVLLEVGDGATLPDELDRAVEVAASVLSAAADESGTGVSGTYRLVTTAGLDTGAQRGQDALQNVLIAIAAVAPAPTPVPGRFSAAVARLGQPDHDEALVIVGAFGRRPPDREVLGDLVRVYSAVVLVLVGAACLPGLDQVEATWRADSAGAATGGFSEIGPCPALEPGGGQRGTLLTVPLPPGRSLAGAWSRLDPEGTTPVDDLTDWLGDAREVSR